MKRLFTIIVVLIIAGTGTYVHGVMPPSHYQRLIEDSKIKAIATVESVRLVEDGKRFSRQEAVFKLEKAISENVPERFSGACNSVLHKWQKPGVGGEIYFYPKKGDRVFVAVSEDGGWINSYTQMTQKLETAFTKDPDSVVFGMGDARVIEGEREKTIFEHWYRYRIDQKPVGYLHTVAKEMLYQWGILHFEHRFVVRDESRLNAIEIHTYCRDDNYLTPRNMTLKFPDTPPIAIKFVIKSAHKVMNGIFRPDPASEKNTMAIPDHTVTDLLMFEIVKRLSFENETFTYHHLESTELNLKKDKALKAMGKDPQNRGLYRYIEISDKSASFWVDEDRNLVRVLWDDDKEFIQTDKATATASVP